VTTVLVTGAAGFVGANLARRLVDDGHQVHVLLRPDHDLWRLADVLDDLRVHHASLEDVDDVRVAVRRIAPDRVFHLAAHGAYPDQTDFRRMVETNVLGTMNLMEALVEQGAEAVVNTGSSSEYGFKDHPPDEDEPLEPNSHYAVTKAAATMYCHQVGPRHGLRLCTVRLYSVYGPFEEPRRLWPTLLLRALEGRLPPLVGPGVARDYVHVDDVVEAYLLAATAPQVEPGAVYNVGTGVQTTLAELVEVCRRTLSVEDEPRWGSMPERTWDTDTWVANVTRIGRTLGWRPRTTVADGVVRFVDWFRQHPDLAARYERTLDASP
jgi:UDP-glucose 4-epimerase